MGKTFAVGWGGPLSADGASRAACCALHAHNGHPPRTPAKPSSRLRFPHHARLRNQSREHRRGGRGQPADSFLLDRQQFADPLGLAERLGISSATWPLLFGLLWPSGGQLALQLAGRTVQPDERVLEMGCGLACPAWSRTAGAWTSRPATATRSRPAFAQQPAPQWPSAHEVPAWGLGCPAASAGFGAHSTTLRGRYDLLVGSDLLYDRDASAWRWRVHWPPRAAAGRGLDRGPRPGQPPCLSRQMQALGFGLREQRLDTTATAQAAQYKGRLLVYRRSA